MRQENKSKSNFDLWNLIGKVRHSIFLARQKELSQYNIAVRQAYVLRAIQDLGSKATIREIAKEVERGIPVISRQTATLEKDGLIKRIKDRPKLNLLRLELTQKGLDLIKISSQSKMLDGIFSFLSEEDRQYVESILNRILKNVDEYTSS